MQRVIPSTPPTLPSFQTWRYKSIYSRIYHAAYDAIKTFSNHFNGYVTVSEEKSQQYKVLFSKNDQSITLNRVLGRKKLSNIAFGHYKPYLEEKFPHLQLEPKFINGSKINKDELPEFREGKTLLAIPFIIQRKICGIIPSAHIVTAVIDRSDPDNTKLDFFDSKGFNVNDLWFETILSKNETPQTLGLFMDMIKTKYQPKVIEENTTKHQWDSHNCGVHVLNYISKRAAQEDTTPLSYEDAQQKYRLSIINNLYYHHVSSAQDAQKPNSAPKKAEVCEKTTHTAVPVLSSSVKPPGDSEVSDDPSLEVV